MSFSKRLLSSATSGITPSEHFGVVLYEGDGTTSNSINGGKFGAAANFNGTSSTIVIPNSIEQPLIFAKEFGVSMWFNLASLPTGSDEDFLISLYQEGYLDIRVKANGVIQGKVAEETTGTDRLVTSANSVISANTWYHVVWTGETNNLILYVNGSSVATGSTWNGTYYHSNAGCRIGSKSGPSFYFNGKIDQTRIFQKYLSSSEVSTLYAETAATVESLDPLSEDTTDTLQVLGDSSCVATYRFENNEDDLSGNYNGTGTGIQYTAGRYGQAASFANNSDAKMQLSSKILADNDNLTISFWIKNMSCGDYGTIIGEGVDSVTAGYNVQINPDDNSIDFFRSAGGGSYVFSGNSYNFGISGSDWVHCCFTVSTTQLKYYKNGINVLTASVSNTSSVTGNYNTSFMWDEKYERYQKGDLDQVRVFHKTLSAAEVTTLYNENPLVASYRFEGNANDDMRTYDGTATNVTYEYGLGFTPDFIWCKTRSATGDHNLTDSTRGAQKGLNPNTNAVEGNQAPLGVTSFDTGGFTVSDNSGGGASVNGNGQDYVAWCLKANGGTTSSNTDGNSTSIVQVNPDAGFSIVKYVGNQTAGHRIGHGLGVVPQVIILKCLNNVARPWYVYHVGVDANNPSHYNLRLNETDARQDSTTEFNDTEPTSTVFTLGTASGPNGSGADYIAYCFHSVEGFSKFGSYTGNGVPGGGPIIETGFEPAFVMIKHTNTSAYGWYMFDNKRSPGQEKRLILRADTNGAEYDGGYYLEFLSNGFRINTNSGPVNINNGTFIYMAFAADPDTEAPTVAKSFSTVAYTGNGAARNIDLGFGPSLVWIKSRSFARNHYWYDILRGANVQLLSNSTAGNATNAQRLTAFNTDSFSVGTSDEVNKSAENYVAWAWKADDNESTINTGGSIDSVVSANANAGFSIVKFNKTTDASTASTFGHGLSSAPEMIILKRTDGTEDWYVYHTSMGNAARVQLNSSAAQTTGTNVWGQTNPTATVFTVESFNAGNAIAYCFHSVSNYSKIGSYAGTGSAGNAQNIGFQPDFVLGKSYDNPEDWFIVDSVRGGNKYLRPNLTNTESTAGASITFTSTGFQFTGGSFNNSGMNFIYMAIKIN